MAAIFHFLEHPLDPSHLFVGLLLVDHEECVLIDALELIKSAALDLDPLTFCVFLVALCAFWYGIKRGLDYGIDWGSLESHGL